MKCNRMYGTVCTVIINRKVKTDIYSYLNCTFLLRMKCAFYFSRSGKLVEGVVVVQEGNSNIRLKRILFV